MKKKELKLAKIEERAKKESKEHKTIVEEKDFKRHQKRKHVEDQLRDI